MMLAKRLLSRRRWTPAFWFDGDDPSTITQSSGVTQWADKSGNGRHAAPITANKPTYTLSGIGGHGSIVFPSADAGMITPSFAAPTGDDGLLIAWVAKQTGTPTTYPIPLCYGAVNAQWSFVLPRAGVGSINKERKCIWRNVSGVQAVSTTDFGLNTTRIVIGVVKNADGMRQFFGGTLEGTSGPATHNLGSAAALAIGGAPTPGNMFEGMIGEILGVYGDTSQGAVSDIRNYLIDKWL